MILDAGKGFGQQPPRYDLCIVGAGPAGLAVALELETGGWRVCVLEAGGAAYERDTQRLFEGEVVGQPYPPLRDSRLGALGGSTTVWAGWCRPLEPLAIATPEVLDVDVKDLVGEGRVGGQNLRRPERRGPARRLVVEGGEPA
jgi:choline dehydrogenase-like flavoprotein